MSSTVDFDNALVSAVSIAEKATIGTQLVVVVLRDVFGRCTLVIDDRSSDLRPEVDTYSDELKRELGPWCAEPPIGWATDLFDQSALFDDPASALHQSNSIRVAVVERAGMGDGWLHVQAPLESNRTRPVTVAFASLKGGVGRSTAACVFARASAAAGKCVLLVDLDLESPGLGHQLLKEEEQPAAGLVDVLVKAAVGELNVSDALHLLSGSEGNGDLWLLPAGGRPTESYTFVPKLDRAYTEFVDEDGRLHSLSTRLQEAIDLAVDHVASRSRMPDLVLLDCRAGIHDIAGSVLSSISDLGLLFASDSAQSWAGFSDIFRQWAARPAIAGRLRERLQLVAAMVDEGSFSANLASFRDRGYELFSQLYDETPVGETPEDFFGPVLEDEFAPHSPIAIPFLVELRSLSPARLAEGMEAPSIRIAFEGFVEELNRIISDLPSNRGEGS